MKITDQERQEIIEICEKYNIENYTIREDGTVDVDKYVDLSYKNLTELPLKFGIVTSSFDCRNNKLTYLKGAPKEVTSWFDCSGNELTSLEGSPKKVGGNFICLNNKLTSIKGAPKEVVIFDCSKNELTSLKFGPLIVKSNFNCKDNTKDNPKELEQPLTIINGKFINI